MSGTGIKAESKMERVPLRLVLLSIIGLWAAYYGLISARTFIMGLDYQGDMLWRRGLVSAAGAVLTFLLWLLLRRFDFRPLWVQAVAALILALPAAYGIAWVNKLIFAPIEERALKDLGEKRGLNVVRDKHGNLVFEVKVDNPSSDGDPLEQPQIIQLAGDGEATYFQQITEIAVGRYFMLLAWCSLYFAMLAGERARSAERREGEFRQAARDAELRSLRYQVNPHFLFNTLNSLSALILTDKNDRAEEMVQSIASFYRQSLTDDPTSDLTVEDEFELQKHYLAIEAVRFPERLKTVYDLPSDLADACLPGMILQPLVENSVKYAVAATTEAVTITLSAREEFDRLVLTVSDNGPGGEVATNGANGHGIGLVNVRRRLEARFGKDVTVVSGSTEKGYSTIIRIPLVYHGNC